MSELLQLVRDIKTLGEGVPVYKRASISFQEFHPDQVYPISKYVLMGNIRRLEEVRNTLLQRGVDIFHLQEAVQYGDYTITPPVVEYSRPDRANLIVDGIHRFFYAREMGETVTAVHVRRVRSDLPVIGLPVGWEEVARCEELPLTGPERRRLRPNIPDDSTVLRRYYRDYSPLGSTGRRPTVGQEG